VSKSQLAKAIGGTYGKPVIKFDLAAMQSGIIGSSGANLRAAQKTVDAIKGDGKVFAIATCNSINSLPPELQGRFNLGTFFFDVPTPEEAAVIWNIYRKRYQFADSDPTPAHVGWTGREIEECARKAWSLRLTLEEAAQYIVPVIKSRADSIAHLRQSCSGKYLSASHPGVYEWSGETVQASLPVFSGDSGRKVRA
jgi:SpoVK/Ycf46/Vps4 family AAA+-type ATPase